VAVEYASRAGGEHERDGRGVATPLGRV